MKIFIFIYVTLFSFISSSIVFAEEKISELRCEMKNYRLNNYSKKWGLSWVPENYNVSFFSSNQSGRVRGKTFKITLNDKDKIKFEYKQTHKNQSYTVVNIYILSQKEN